MALILPAAAGTPAPTGADQIIPVDVTLAVADTAETLFTVPAGKKVRSFALANVSPGNNTDAHLSFTAGVPATTGDFRMERREAGDEQGLDLAEGTYSFIGGAGDTPQVRGWVTVGPA